MPKLLLIFLLLILASPVFAGQEEARELVRRGEIVPLEQLIRQANQHVPGRVIEAELERDDGRLVYELELLDEHGQVWEFVFDAHNGKLLKKERED